MQQRPSGSGGACIGEVAELLMIEIEGVSFWGLANHAAGQ